MRAYTTVAMGMWQNHEMTSMDTMNLPWHCVHQDGAYNGIFVSLQQDDAIRNKEDQMKYLTEISTHLIPQTISYS